MIKLVKIRVLLHSVLYEKIGPKMIKNDKNEVLLHSVLYEK